MKFLFVSVFALVFACTPVKTMRNSTFVHVDSDSIRFVGRVKHLKDSAAVYWSGTSITFRFKGKVVKALLRDQYGRNYFNVVIDGDSLHYFKLDASKRYYVLAENLNDQVHTVELIKRAEWDRGETWFYGLQIEDGLLMEPPPANSRVIEFFGNSITAGYAIENYTGGDSPDSTFTNNYWTYAAITARHFHADLYCTVRSGIGITVSWFPLIMSEIYNRLDPVDASSVWDFNKVKPQIVVINLFQNDAWLVKMKDHPSFIQRFGTQAPDAEQIIKAYKDFVTKIRSAYPDAHIICALGCMDAMKENAPWRSYVERAVADLNDQKMYTLFFPFMNKPGHPRKEDNARMADQLIKFIDTNIKW